MLIVTDDAACPQRSHGSPAGFQGKVAGLGVWVSGFGRGGSRPTARSGLGAKTLNPKP